MNALNNKKIILFGIFFAIFSASYNFYFFSNQNTYLLHAYLLSNPDVLNNDWLSNTIDGTPVFSIFTSYLFSFGDALAINFNKIFEVIFYVYLFKLIQRSYPTKNQIELALIVLIICFASSYFLPIFMGLKGQSILGGIYQPSIFGVFLLSSLYHYLEKQYIKSYAFLLIATIFHPSLLLTSVTLGIIFLLFLKNYKQQLIFLSAGIIGFIPLILYIYFNIYVLEYSSSASNILVNFRIPHHADLSNFNFLDVVRIILCALCIYACKDDFLKKILLATFVFICFYLVLANVIDSNSFLLLFPMRISQLLLPIVITVVSIEIFYYLKNFIDRIISERAIILCCKLVVSILVILNSAIVYKKMNNDLFYNLTSFTSQEEVWLIPPDSANIRLNLKQPVFIDEKSHPINHKEITEWKTRLDYASEFYSSSSESEQQNALNEIKNISNIGYVLTESPDTILINLDLIYQNNNRNLFLYKVR